MLWLTISAALLFTNQFGHFSEEAEAQPTTTSRADARVRNVIVMISDGAGYNTLAATRYWTGRPLAVDEADWQQGILATHALRGDAVPCDGHEPDEQHPEYEYNPQRNYDITPAAGVRPGSGEVPGRVYPRAFAGYEWNRDFRPDSANTMTAMMTGVATYPGGVNVDGNGEALESLAEVADRAGKRIGVVSSVQFNHATPASAAGAHNVSRSNYHALAREILAAGVVDVIAGPNNPDYDDNGRKRATPSYSYLGEDEWTALKLGNLADETGERWTLVQNHQAIVDLAEGKTPEKLIIVPQIYRTLQQKRSSDANARETSPGDDARLPNLPTLSDLTRAALNAIDDNPDGFFLMVEGGAVDWAMHDNQLGRMIEEQLEFDEAIKAVVAYLDAETNGHSWENTLVIVTADHDHLLFGPDADRQAYQPVQDRGPGVLPGHRWFFDHHSNQLVPMFIRGAGSERIISIETTADTPALPGLGRGPFMHQGELGKALLELMEQPN